MPNSHFFFLILLGAATDTPGEEARTDAPIQLDIRLKDGGFVRGVPKDVRKLKLMTVLGPVEIPFRHIRTVSREEELYVIDLANSMRLKGKLELKALPVASRLGAMNLPVQQILSLSVSRPLPKPLQEGLVLHYDFENIQAGKVIDLSGEKNHGKLYGTSLAPGINGSGMKFDPGDYIDAGDAPSLKLSRLTVAAWVWLPFFKDNRFWIQKGQIGARGIDFGFQISAGRGLWFITNHGNNYVGGNTQHPTFAEKWHHIAATWDDESRVNFFMDGKPSAIEQAEGELGPLVARFSLKIGRWSDHKFVGRADEVTVYSRILTADRIRALAQWPRDNYGLGIETARPLLQKEPKQTWQDGLVAWLTGDGHSLDRSQLNHPIESAKSRYASDRHGWPESAFDLDDGSKPILLPAEQTLNTDEAFTLSAWIRPRSFNDKFGRPRYIFSKWHSGTTHGDYILEIDKGRLRLRLMGNKPRQVSGFSHQGNIPVDEWTHVAVTFLRGRVHFFVNAKSAGQYSTQARTTYLQPYKHDRLAIGALSWQAQNQFDGQLDDIRIHNRSLTGEEIETMMNYSTAPRIKLDDYVWSAGRTKFKIQDGLHTVPKAREGFSYGVNGRGPLLSTHLGDRSWKDFVMDFDFLVKQASPELNQHNMPEESAGVHFLFRVQNLRENWLEQGLTAYRLSFLQSGEWEFHRLHNIRRMRGLPEARGRKVALGKGKFPAFLDKEHHLNVQAIGGTLKIQFNNNFQIQINDGVKKEGTSPLLYGGFAIQWAAESMGYFRNFKLVPLEAF
ncbi:MAG: LamG domain-containing protein [Planctomycetota bacterium]|jgi:hypothetical protein|nr:LamG domain-containing protein [Planctomycetota bacterium]